MSLSYKEDERGKLQAEERTEKSKEVGNKVCSGTLSEVSEVGMYQFPVAAVINQPKFTISQFYRSGFGYSMAQQIPLLRILHPKSECQQSCIPF